jgi:hypothetical protein
MVIISCNGFKMLLETLICNMKVVENYRTFVDRSRNSRTLCYTCKEVASSTLCQTTRHHIPKDNTYCYCLENPKFRTKLNVRVMQRFQHGHPLESTATVQLIICTKNHIECKTCFCETFFQKYSLLTCLANCALNSHRNACKCSCKNTALLM